MERGHPLRGYPETQRNYDLLWFTLTPTPLPRRERGFSDRLRLSVLTTDELGLKLGIGVDRLEERHDFVDSLHVFNRNARPQADCLRPGR